MINSVRGGLVCLVLVCAGLCLAQGQPSDWAVPDAEISVTTTDAQSAPAAEEQGTATQQQRRGRGTGRGMGRGIEGVYRARVTPHWFAGNTRFWYRNDLRGQTKEFVLVDAEEGTRGPAFDHAKLAAALSKAAGEEYKAEQLPFSDIEFIEDGKAIRFTAGAKTWRCDLATHACSVLAADANTPAATGQEDAQAGPAGMRGRGRGRGAARGSDPNRPLQSPDGRWAAFVKDRNVYVRTEPNGPEAQLTQDGQEGNAYGRLEWSPDSATLVAWRIEPGERKEVYRIRSSPAGGGRATFTASPYALPGDKFTLYELNLFDVALRKQTKPQVDRFEHEWQSPELHWDREGRSLSYRQVDRGHQRFRVIQVDKQAGTVRSLIDEKTETFIWTAHMEGPERLGLQIVTWLEQTDDLIYASERDGWRHLYLVDGHGGGIKRQITRGPWVVRGIDRIDEDNRQIEFLASGMNPGHDPYFIHYYRINLDGTGLVALTDGNGNHGVEYSPDRRYFIDAYSRVDMAPVNELRRTSDGRLVCRLEEADITELKTKGWTPPEVFVAKGRDGKTDIWGLIYRPADLDPGKEYPIIEDLYAGPQDSFTPKTFGPARYEALTRLGFIVVKMDGMGTANRSKAFHDVCWKNLKDAGFPDRIAWIKAAAVRYPYVDITRVGVYGGSAGGQSAAGGVLFYPEFYKAAAANCGCHDNRMDKASWNEQWMGYPVGPQYAESSNIENAAKLQGHLFLSVGEVDDNVPPESTMRFVDALIRANKDFDLLVVPNGGHGAGGNYYQRRMQDFFTRHLLGIEPPNRNAAPTTGS